MSTGDRDNSTRGEQEAEQSNKEIKDNSNVKFVYVPLKAGLKQISRPRI